MASGKEPLSLAKGFKDFKTINRQCDLMELSFAKYYIPFYCEKESLFFVNM